MPNGNGNNGSSGGSTNSGTDYGALIEDVGGLVDQLFDGSFWDFIAGLGCMSSSFKLRDLKDNFPTAINAMRDKSGVAHSMTVENVNEFSKRLSHLYGALETRESGQPNSCKGKYRIKFMEMLNTYRNELHELLLSSGFEKSDDSINNMPGTQGFSVVRNYNQNDIANVAPFGVGHTIDVAYRSYKQSYGQGSGSNYGTIGDPSYNSGGIFSGGSFSPTMSSFNVMNYALGGILLFGFYKYAKDNKLIKL